MKPLLATALVLAIAAFGCNSTIGKADDGAPVSIAVEHPIERNQQLAAEAFAELGIAVSAVDAGGGDYGLYVALSEDLRTAIKAGRAGVHFSLWSHEGSFVLGLPPVNTEGGPFLLTEGFLLRVMLDPKSGYAGLKPGTGYFALFDRGGYIMGQ